MGSNSSERSCGVGFVQSLRSRVSEKMLESMYSRIDRTAIVMSAQSPRASGVDDERDGAIATSHVRPKLARPPLYKVVLFNDDYTPMDFVVDVLCSFFSMNVEKATQIMLRVHTEGKAVCGVFSKDVAETKAQQVNDYSRDCEQPLLCHVEIDN